MRHAGCTMTVAEELLAGPRGRRLCLNYVSGIDQAVGEAVFWLGHALDPNPGTLIRFGDGQSDDPTFTADDVADLIRGADLSALSRGALRDALCASVEQAMYWQEADGSDAVAALPPVREALASVAERVAAEHPNLTTPAQDAQWAVEWVAEADSGPLQNTPAQVLSEWGVVRHEAERQAIQERPADPRANFSGEWWSIPHGLLTTRSNALDALQLVEDPLGWDVATVIPVRGSGRVREIGSAEDWAALCREYPADVTATRRHDWLRVTGHEGPWLIPDWERVAQQWDAVHLTTVGYLSAATRLIMVDGERASVIGGWAPDSTVWLSDVVREAPEPRQQWRRAEGGNEWVRDDGDGA